MEWWHVYLFTRLDSLKSVCVVLLILSGMFTVSCLIFSADEFSEPNKHLRWGIVGGIVAFLFFGLVQLATPTQKEAAAIYLLPKLAHSDFAKEAQQIPTDAAKLMRMKLESWIADMDPKAEKK